MEQAILFAKIVAMVADARSRLQKPAAHGAILLTIKDLSESLLPDIAETLHSASRHAAERDIPFPVDKSVQPRHEADVSLVEAAGIKSIGRELHLLFGPAKRVDEIFGS